MSEGKISEASPYERNNARLSARVPKHVKEVIQMAAELTGASETQFMAQAAYEAAQKIIEQERIVRLSHTDTTTFLDMLDNPPAPNERLKSAVADYKESGLNAES